jgi:hypothetical protein
VIGLALSAARVLGKSRARAVFGGLVALAGLLNEIQQRRQQGSEAAAEG